MQPAIKSTALKRGRAAPKRGWRIPREANFLTIFWTICAFIAGYALYTSFDRPAAFTLAALMVTALALFPSYLWCKGSVSGLPIFPVFCATFIITHGFQLLVSYQMLATNSTDVIWRAVLTVCGFLLVGTLVWRACVAWPRAAPVACRVMRGGRGTALLLLIMGVTTVFTVVDHGGWLQAVPAGVFSAARGFIKGLNSFAVVVLAMRWGARALSPSNVTLFVVLFLSFVVVDIASLFLVVGIATSLMMAIGFAIGRKAVPWGMLVALVAIPSFLHFGKGQMRELYWGEGQGHIIQPWSLPGFFAEWIQTSASQIISQRHSGEMTPSIFARANTMDLLLQAQRMSPEEVPFLHGATYSIIPDALVPRVVHPGKISPHDSTSMLNIHYGNQTWEATQVTSIGWGMLNEAFANFGYAGCFGLAVILGAFYGLMTRWSIGLPLTSLQSMVGIYTMSFAIQTEMTAAIFITAYLQGLFALLVLAFLFSERQRLKLARAPGANRQSAESARESGRKLTRRGHPAPRKPLTVVPPPHHHL